MTLALSTGWRAVFCGGDDDAPGEGRPAGGSGGFAEELWSLDLALLWRSDD